MHVVVDADDLIYWFVTFNSLFEMQMMRVAVSGIRAKDLSILYLRCTREALWLDRVGNPWAFNSLFEMPWAGAATSETRRLSFQFSI